MKTLVLLIASVSLIIGCTSVPRQRHDICYGLQGEALEDCILRHREHSEPLEYARPARDRK